MAEHDQQAQARLHLLVLRCQAGDDRAISRLFDLFGERSLRYLLLLPH